MHASLSVVRAFGGAEDKHDGSPMRGQRRS
jgi:hypothetical protein